MPGILYSMSSGNSEKKELYAWQAQFFKLYEYEAKY